MPIGSSETIRNLFWINMLNLLQETNIFQEYSRYLILKFVIADLFHRKLLQAQMKASLNEGANYFRTCAEENFCT